MGRRQLAARPLDHLARFLALALFVAGFTVVFVAATASEPGAKTRDTYRRCPPFRKKARAEWAR